MHKITVHISEYDDDEQNYRQVHPNLSHVCSSFILKPHKKKREAAK
jgi:hypothetical protein